MAVTKPKLTLELVVVIGLIGTGAGVCAGNLCEVPDDRSSTTEISTTPARPVAQVTDPKEFCRPHRRSHHG